MKAIYLVGIVLLCLSFAALPQQLLPSKAADQEKEEFTLGFYSEQITLAFLPAMRVQLPATIDHHSLSAAYRSLQNLPSDVLLQSLLTAQEAYALNDYLFFQLADYALSFIYQARPQTEKQLALFDVLNRAGFDAKLTYRSKQLFINVYTQDELFEVPLIEQDGRQYANLSCIRGDCQQNAALYVFQQPAKPQAKPFSFQIRSWPKLTPKPIQRKLHFTYQQKTEEIQLAYDQTIVDIMRAYPFLSEYCYLESPLSPTLSESLLPQLQLAMAGKNLAESLSFLAAFTRSAFAYQDDNVYFGYSKPMVPEELFGYAYSDCEDRCSLFFALSKELLQIPVLVIAYDDHLSLAVGSEDLAGDNFRYNNQRYIFCDPTGPANSSEIGKIPHGYEGRPFEIIFAHP